MDELTSPSNPRVKAVVRLQRQAGERRRTGLFCVESARELGRALDAGFDVEQFYLCPQCFEEGDLVDRVAATGQASMYRISQPVLQKLAYRQNPQGMVAVLRARSSDLATLELADPALVVVCSGLEKPGNIGAILRSADAAGASAVFIDCPGADVFNPNTVRASTGAVFALPIVCEAREALIDWCRQRGVLIVAASPDADHPHTEADLRGPSALVVGSEAAGLDPAWREAADTTVVVPMHGSVDSLNVSVTAALLAFEAMRQRDR